jgi:hypothetical protein
MWTFVLRFYKDTQISDLMKFRPVGAEFDADRLVEVTKLIVASHNFV